MSTLYKEPLNPTTIIDASKQDIELRLNELAHHLNLIFIPQNNTLRTIILFPYKGGESITIFLNNAGFNQARDPTRCRTQNGRV